MTVFYGFEVFTRGLDEAYELQFRGGFHVDRVIVYDDTGGWPFYLKSFRLTCECRQIDAVGGL